MVFVYTYIWTFWAPYTQINKYHLSKLYICMQPCFSYHIKCISYFLFLTGTMLNALLCSYFLFVINQTHKLILYIPNIFIYIIIQQYKTMQWCVCTYLPEIKFNFSKNFYFLCSTDTPSQVFRVFIEVYWYWWIYMALSAQQYPGYQLLYSTQENTPVQSVETFSVM